MIFRLFTDFLKHFFVNFSFKKNFFVLIKKIFIGPKIKKPATPLEPKILIRNDMGFVWAECEPAALEVHNKWAPLNYRREVVSLKLSNFKINYLRAVGTAIAAPTALNEQQK